MMTMVNQLNKGMSERRSDAARNHDTLMMAFRSDLEWMAIAWRDDILCGVVFGYSTERQAGLALVRALKLPDQFCRFNGGGQPDEIPAWVDHLRDDLCRFAAGEQVDFSAVRLDTNHLTPFGRRVVAECRRIRSGQVRTYGQLAAKCGKPGAARAVGSVMAKNRFPLIVPCHRVLGAGGSLGGYSAPEGLQMKRRLLAMEKGFASTTAT
jgi:methylated-DNA-[protein]-cysteine S-methyltransferase